MKTVFLLLVYLATGAHYRELPLKTLIAKHDATVCSLSSEQFSYRSYVNSYAEEGTVWIETEIPPGVRMQGCDILCFNPEVLFMAEVFVEAENGGWLFVGKTGAGLRPAERSIGTWLNALELAPVLSGRVSERHHPIRLRIKLTSAHSSPVSLLLLPAKDFIAISNAASSYLAFAAAVCICITIYIFFGSTLFKDTESIFPAVICLLLLLHLFIETGTVFRLVGSFYALGQTVYKMNYFLICLLLLSGILTVQKRNAGSLAAFPQYAQKLFDFIPIFNIIIITAGIIYFVIDVSEYSGKFIQLGAMAISLMFITVQCFLTMRFNPDVKKIIYFLYMGYADLFFVQQLFRTLRLLPDAPHIFRLFDNDLDLLETATLITLAAVALMRIYGRIRSKLMQLKLSTANADRQMQISAKKSYVYSNLAAMLLNPLHLFLLMVERNKTLLPAGTAAAMRDGIRWSNEIVNTLYLLSYYEQHPFRLEATGEPLDLREFALSCIKNEVSNLRLSGCAPDVRTNFPETTAVAVDRTMLSVFFKFVLRAVNRYVKTGTPALITVDYTNYTLLYSVHFYAEPLSHAEAKQILELESVKGAAESLDESIGKWGIHLYVVRQILNLLNGNIKIVPDSYGNTISAWLALPPTVAPAKNPSDLEDAAAGSAEFAVENAKPLYGETIYILEENTALRTALLKELRPFFKTVAFNTGNALHTHREANRPDLLVCSLSLPGKSPFDLLREDKKLSSIPIIVTAGFVTQKARVQLLELGVLDIVQKPFSMEQMLLKIRNIMQIRRLHSEAVIDNVSSTLKKSLLAAAPEHDAPEGGAHPALEASGASVKSANPALTAHFTAVGLTKKEMSIAHLVASGMSDKEVAVELNIAPATVAVHNKKIFKKLGIHSRTELKTLTAQKN